MGSVRERESEMAEMNTHGWQYGFSERLLCSARVEIFPSLYNFPEAHAILMVTPPTYALHMDLPPV